MRNVQSLLAVLIACLPGWAGAQAFGINTRHDPARNADVASLAQQRNFRSLRMDLLWDRDPGALRDQARRMREQGGNVQVSLQISYQWDHSCNPRLGWVEQDAYEQTAGAVNKVKDLIHDFELLNEGQLRPDIYREVPWNSAGASTAPYEGKPCVATLAAVYRGMSRAIMDIRASSGLPLRVILGTIGRDWGFLKHMRNQGVRWDVTGYHVYPHHHSPTLLSDPWYGPGGPLAQLAAFGKPVHINEFNCGETYDRDYGNRDGDAKTETCLKSLVRHLTDLRSQKAANIEVVHFYELFDEPAKAAPENRFGLVKVLASPKPHLYVATAFAGGALSAQERLELTRRKLLAGAETPLPAPPARPAPAASPSPGS